MKFPSFKTPVRIHFRSGVFVLGLARRALVRAFGEFAPRADSGLREAGRADADGGEPEPAHSGIRLAAPVNSTRLGGFVAPRLPRLLPRLLLRLLAAGTRAALAVRRRLGLFACRGFVFPLCLECA